MSPVKWNKGILSMSCEQTLDAGILMGTGFLPCADIFERNRDLLFQALTHQHFNLNQPLLTVDPAQALEEMRGYDGPLPRQYRGSKTLSVTWGEGSGCETAGDEPAQRGCAFLEALRSPGLPTG